MDGHFVEELCHAAAMTRSDEDYEHALIDWAQSYNCYERIGDSDRLQTIYGPIMDETDRLGRIPEWMGVDLLRGWASYLARVNRWTGRQSIFDEFPVFGLIVEAVRHHHAVEPRDVPPTRRR